MMPVRVLFLFIIFCFTQCKSKETKVSSTLSPQLQFYNDAIENSPFEDSLYGHRAQYAYEQGDYSSALKDLNYAIKLDSTKPEYFHLLADVQLDSGNSYDALQTMIRATHSFQDRIPTLLKLCEFFHILKQYDRSLTTSAKIIQLNPVLGDGYYMAALNYRDLKDTTNAIAYLKKATTYDDRLIDGWILLGQLLATKDITEAKVYFENAIKLESANVHSLHSYAESLHGINPIKSQQLYAQIIHINPRYTAAYLNSGIIYFSIDSFQLALNQFDILCKIESTNAKHYYYRGTAKEALGNIIGAKTDYEQALKLDPTSKEVKDALTALAK